jgi:hypothetical protein
MLGRSGVAAGERERVEAAENSRHHGDAAAKGCT